MPENEEADLAGKRGRSGRRPGGSSAKVAYNTKMDPDLRARLQKEAGQAGRSLSAEIEARLRSSFKKTPDEAAAALAFLVESAAVMSNQGKMTWRNNEGTFGALKAAIVEIMEMLNPKHIAGFESTPFEHPTFKTPEELGKSIAFWTWNYLDVSDGRATDLPLWNAKFAQAARNLKYPHTGDGHKD